MGVKVIELCTSRLFRWELHLSAKSIKRTNYVLIMRKVIQNCSNI